uniref:Glycophorin C (Gerbich blood group) n=1 Tax=Podarcis muralis TaxID=64176 RepID=A0A670K1H8_PODMU
MGAATGLPKCNYGGGLILLFLVFVLYCLYFFLNPVFIITMSKPLSDVLLCVIAAVAFVLICLLVVMLRYMYRHKGTYHTNEAKGTEFAESADAALKNDPTLQEAMDESRKEYFI